MPVEDDPTRREGAPAARAAPSWDQTAPTLPMQVQSAPGKLVLAAGARVGRYEIIRPLGSGGMGTVVLARDLQLGRLSALKFLDRSTEEEALRRFLREATATARLSHENVVVIYEVGEHEGRPFMALEHLKGQTFRQWIEERSAQRGNMPGTLVPPRRAAELMVPVVRALVHAHANGIVHRDLKPANVMITETGSVKVLDFGIAKLVAETQGDPRRSRPSLPSDLTQTGSAIGTTAYMAPEQWRDEVDHRTDLWAAGLMLHELLFGTSPVRRLMEQGANAHLEAMLDLSTPLSDLASEHPELGRLGAIIDRCLIKRKEDRMLSAAVLLDELLALLPAHTRARDEERDPFAGLSAFQESDAERFFGRDRVVHQAMLRLAEQPLLAVIGPSGAGKSSFVRAGLIPALKQSGDAWEVFVLRPGPNPLSSLAELLGQYAWQSSDGLTGEIEASPVSTLERNRVAARLVVEPGHLGMALRARARRRRERVLLFLDQFEEVYTLAPERERASLFACLAGVADDAASPLRVVLTLRSDFLDRLGEAQATLPDLGRGLLLMPLDRHELADALVRPLAALDYRLDPPELLDEMMDELAHTRGPLPLLQFTAAQLWARRDRTRRVLSRATYRALGGVGGTLGQHADAVVSALTPGDRQIARTLLLRLVTPERTRAPASLRELCDLGPDPAEIRRVLDQLLSARLVALEGSGADESVVEIVHESLLVNWPTLARWLGEEAEDAAFLARLRNAARAFRVGGEREGLLWSGQEAEEARRFWARRKDELAHAEARFLEAVIAKEQRWRTRRRQILAVVLMLLSTVTVLVSYLAVSARASAARARNAARMAAAREHENDATTALALAREIEPGPVPRGWGTLTRWALDWGVARVVISLDGATVGGAWSPDGRHLALASHDKTVRISRADGTGELLVLRGHTDSVSAVAWSPDGRRVASASHDKTIRIWSADGAGEPLVLRGHTGGVSAVTWSPDGQRIATASVDNTVRIWSVGGAGEPLVLRGHTGGVSAVAWSPDGNRVASSSDDKTARVWSARGAGEPFVLLGHTGGVRAVAWSPDGQRVATASADNTVRVWGAGGANEPLVLAGHEGPVRSVAWGPDGRRIASASFDKTVRIWSVDGPSPPKPRVLRGHTDKVTFVAWNADGSRVLSAAADSTVRVWDARTLRELFALQGHVDRVVWAGWSPDGRRLATASQDATARIWDANDTGRALVLRGHEDVVWWAEISPDGTRIASSSCDATARVWRADGSGEPLVLRGHEGCVYSATWSPDGRRIASAGEDKTVRVWNADGTGEPLVLRGHEAQVYTTSWSPDGRRIASAGGDKTVRVWSADGSGEPLVLRGHSMEIWAVTWSSDGRIASASPDRTVRVWSADGAGEPFVLPTPSIPNGVAFSPDSRRLACGIERAVQIWDTMRWGEPLVLYGHTAVASLSGGRPWSPEGRRILSYGDRTLRLWNADGAGEPLVLRMPSSASIFRSAALSPDGRRIIASDEAQILVWNDIELPLGPNDPRLWRATRYCPSIEDRQRLLDVTEEMARRDLARCEERVRTFDERDGDRR